MPNATIHRLLPIAAAFCLLAAQPARAQTPSPVPPGDTWNLADLYPSAAAWNAAADGLDAQIKSFEACKGKLGESVRRFKQCMDLQTEMSRTYGRLYVYASQQLAGDTGQSASLELNQKADVIGTRLSEATSFVNPELLKLGKSRIDRFLAADALLKVYRHPLDEVLRAAPHTLDAAGEAILAQLSLMEGAGRKTYSILANADLPWPTIKLSTGEDAKLTPAGYTRWRDTPNADDRARVMDAFFGAFKAYERTFGVTLYSQLQQNAAQAKVRHYPDSIASALDGNRVPVAVIDTLIAQTNANLPTLHRYFKLRARMLGIAQLRYSDIYPPLVHGDLKFPLADAKTLVLEAVAPLGADYVATLGKAFDSRWMDAYPHPGKQSGAHMAGYAYDVHPYVLMNYNGDYESVSTLAHEWGHAMHTVLANRAQPVQTADYPIFIAEIASTFNEELLLNRMLKTAKSDDERLLYLGSALEALRGTFFRQAMFAEFERKIHAQVDSGEPLSGGGLTKTYCEILNRYHGTEAGVMTISPGYCTEWAYIPHFYNQFYVFQYATSIAASSLFAQRVEAGEPGALKRYVDLLGAGGSDYPYELVKTAGVDLASPAPYQALVKRMNGIMDEIEAVLAKRQAGPG